MLLIFIVSDIKKQVHELATSVYQIRGHIKGKTLLPFPQGAAHIDEEEKKARASSGKVGLSNFNCPMTIDLKGLFFSQFILINPY